MDFREQGLFPHSTSVAPLTSLSEMHRPTQNHSPGCGIPLFASLIIPPLLVTIVFMVVLWQTTSASTSQSVDFLSERVFDVVELQIFGQISLLTRGMATTAQLGAAAVLVNSSVTSLQSFFYRSISFVKGPLFFGFSTVTGLYAAARTDLTGAVQIGYCDSTNITGTTNLTRFSLQYWNVNSALQKLSLASVTPFNPLLRPWYVAVASRNFTATFSPVFTESIQGTNGLSLGVPVRSTNGSVMGVVVVDYDLSTIQDALQVAHQALETTGMLVLFTEDGSLIAKSVSSDDNGIQETIAMLPSLPIFGPGSVLQTSLAPFGPCFVLQVIISGQVRPEFYASGLNWRLFVVIPQADYYSKVWRNNRVAAILVAVCSVTFFVVQLFFYRFILAFHMSTLL
eukprot:RCo024620